MRVEDSEDVVRKKYENIVVLQKKIDYKEKMSWLMLKHKSNK